MDTMRNILIIAALSFCWVGLPAQADELVIGYVKTVKGEAYVVKAGQPIKAVVGSTIAAGSVLKTGANASMGVTFKDNTVMSFGPDTELTVDEYVYAPNKGNLKLGASLAKGTLAYLSGAIAKIKPDAVSVKTPTGTIGVRGTHFVVKVEPD
jgi:hypothetical protein